MSRHRSVADVISYLKETHPNLAAKLAWLEDYFRRQEKVIVAFSGGLDSGFLAAVAYQVLGDDAVAVTADTQSLARDELRDAKRVAKEIGIKHRIIKYDELKNLQLVTNPENRCYYCKSSLAKHLKRIAEEYHGTTIVEGTNASDLTGHRPGYKALREQQIQTPLAQADLAKSEIQLIAKLIGLSIHDKPSTACLSSRFPYHTLITDEKLKRVEEAEKYIKKHAKVRQIRVREHLDGLLARIEVDPREREKFFDIGLLDSVTAYLKQLGYRYVTLDIEGYRTGSLNIGVQEKKKHP
ncbi:MAG: ATP-dependent sacrificial sulfur transferase LarE [Candidatus Ranarchaeia archaeon]